jgi:hypothetical protein
LAQGWSSIVESWPYKTIVFTGSPEEFTWILLQERGISFKEGRLLSLLLDSN